MKVYLSLWLVLISHVAFSQGSPWAPIAPFDGPARGGAVSFTIANKIYGGTGTDASQNGMSDFWEYNPNSDEWTQKNDFAGAPRFGAVGFSINGKGYIALGSSDQEEAFFNDVWEYDPIGDEWTQVANFAGTARTGAVVFVKANRAYVGTGRGTEGVNNDFWEFNPISNEWLQVASLPGVARHSASAFCIGTSGYVGTGADAVGNPLNDFWAYNPQQNEWTQKANVGGVPRSGGAAFCIQNIGFIGTGTNEVYLNDFWAYDPQANMWHQIPDFPGSARSGAIAESQGNHAFVGTGTNGAATQDFYQLEARTPQTITFAALPSKTFGDAAFTLTATASSSLAVSFQSSNTDVATISGSTVTIVGAGTTIITASQSGNAGTYAAASVSRELVVSKANQAITFNALPQKNSGDSPFGLTATASSGLPITYVSSNSLVATIIGSTVTITGVGTTTITASQAGNANYNAATSETEDLVVSEILDQTITFNALPAKTFGDAPFGLTATASSGLPVSYESSNTLVATVSGSTVTIVGAGTTTITATQAGNVTYSAADVQTEDLVVSKANQTITFNPLPAKTFADADFQLSATTTSGLPISFQSSNTMVATINGSTVTIVGAGAVTITASQPGNGNILAATSIEQVLTVAKADQTITFSSLPEKVVGDAPFLLTAASSSGLGVIYESNNTLVATISGSTVTIVGGGTATITARQTGNANYNAAAVETEELVVTKASQSITFSSLPSKTFGDAGFQLNASVTSGLPITYQSSNPAVATIMGSTITIVGAGTADITASQPGNTAYNAAPSVVRSLTVAKANQTITLENISIKKTDSAPFTLAATASSGLLVAITSGDAAIATTSGNTITVAGVGQTLIFATQPGNANYNAAPVVTRVLTVNPIVIAGAGQGEMWGIAAGGDNGLGVIYKTNSTGSAYAVKYHFSLGANGTAQPRGRLTIATNGKLYGFAGSGPPPMGGVLFEFDPVTNTYTKKIDLPTGSGRPGRGLVAAPNGKLYGIQVAMGNGNSVIFEYNPANNTYTAKHTFIAPVPPNVPPGDLTYLNGKLYGSTQAGGTFSGGFLFEFDLLTDTFTKHADLSGVTGTSQRGPMVLAPNGKLYGVMSQGGSTSNAGTIFEFDPVTNSLTKRRDLEVSSGRGANGLTLAPNGKFYATAIGGGSIGEGTLFEYDPVANSITKKVDFTLMTGCNPMAPLELGSNGKLYGTTSRGGVSSSYTTLFEFDPATGVTSIRKEFQLSAGVTVSEPLTFRNTIISDQTISFPDLGTREFGTIIELNATSSSGLPITYTSEDPSVASVTGSTLTVRALGATNIIANQSGNNQFTPAPEVMRTLTIVKGKQTITFEQLPDRTMGGPRFTVAASTSSGLPISFHTGGDKVSIIGNEVTILKPGLASISATQSGNSFFEPAQSVARVFCVNPARPTITFSNSGGSMTVTLTSSSTVGNQWFFNNTALVGQTGPTLMTSEPGLYKVQASVDGCTSEISNDFPLIVTGAMLPDTDLKLQMYPNPVSNELHIVWPADAEAELREVAVYDLLGRQLCRQAMTGDEIHLDVRPLQSGAYVVRASRGTTIALQRFQKQ